MTCDELLAENKDMSDAIEDSEKDMDDD